jgi:hypothetical protein
MSGKKIIKANKMVTPMVTILVKLSNEALYVIYFFVCGFLFGVWCWKCGLLLKHPAIQHLAYSKVR